MWLHSLSLLILFSAVNGAFEDDCLDLNDGTVKSTYLYGSCFVVDTGSSRPHDSWRTECTHLPQAYGTHLAVLPVKTISDMILQFLADNAVNVWVWISLIQYDTSDEPAGNWEWETESATLPALPIWASAYPSNSGDCGIMYHSFGLKDYTCSSSYQLLCQYVNPVRSACWTEHPNHRFHNGTVVSDEGLVGTGIAGRDVCAKKCGRHILCFGYTMKRDDGHCWIHQDDGQWPEMQPIQDSHYDVFVKDE